MVATLGNGENRAFIYSQDGGTRLLELNTQDVTWGRSLCGISRATMNVAPANCDPRATKIAAWAHSLVVFRDGNRVWEGPIRRITHGRTGFTVAASDVLGWTEKSDIRTARVLDASPVRTEMAWTVTEAFDGFDPDVLPHLQLQGTAGPNVSRDVKVAGGMHSADLASLVAGGGRYTVLGRAIVLWDEATVLGRTPTLIPEEHLLTDVDIIEDGDLLTTGVTARDDDGNTATSGAVDAFYGRVSGILSVSGSQTPASLTQYAASYRDQHYPAPLIIDIPQGAALSCDAPFPMELLVPGVLVPVETTTATGKQVSATMVLSGVSVAQNPQGEKVTVTLVPLTEAAA